MTSDYIGDEHLGLIWKPFGFLLLCFALMACAVPRVKTCDWFKNEKLVGKVVVTYDRQRNYTKKYFNLANQIVRKEYYDNSDMIIDNQYGHAAVNYEYPNQDEIVLRFCGTDNQPACRRDNISKIVFCKKGQIAKIVYYNLRNEPSLNKNGFAMEERKYSPKLKLRQVSFYNERGNPVMAFYKSVKAAAVKFDYIKGVYDSPLVAEHYFDLSGHKITTLFSSTPPVQPIDDLDIIN